MYDNQYSESCNHSTFLPLSSCLNLLYKPSISACVTAGQAATEGRFRGMKLAHENEVSVSA